MLDRTRAAKVALLVGGIVELGGWLAAGARGGLTLPWLVVGLAALLAYAAFARLSYGGARARFAAAGAAALLTFAIAWVSFSHLGLVLGGLAVVGGCLVPAARPPTVGESAPPAA